MGSIEYRLKATLAASLAVSVAAGTSPAIAAKPLAPNDVTWLFPAPTSPADLGDLISIADLKAGSDSTSGPAWSDSDFADFQRLVASAAGKVDGTSDQMALPAAARDRKTWFVAGVRIDPGAPSLAPGVMQTFGRRPQIRLILQTVGSGAPGRPDDVAAHLIYDFVLPQGGASPNGCPLAASPDDKSFQTVVADIVNLRDRLGTGEFGATVVTDGKPLGVHPGLAQQSTRHGLVLAMRKILQDNLAHAHLNAMAVMTVPAKARQPWMFLSMNRKDGHFQPVPSPTLSGKQFAMEFLRTGQVLPTPHTNNQSDITCANASFGLDLPPSPQRKGVSTADIMSAPGMAVSAQSAIFERLANTSQSHFFNTDCVSCHTATRMQVDAGMPVTGISADAVQRGPYDVHNLSWSPEAPGVASVARRTAAETTDTVNWINANMLP